MTAKCAYPGWKLELKAEAKPGNTGDDAGTPAAAACRGATDATDDWAAPDSPISEDNTGLPAPCPPDTPSPAKEVGLGPGGIPGNTGAELRPKPNAEAELGAALGARPGYMEVAGWLEMLVEGAAVGTADGEVAG